jgi:hypothetical protein
MFLKVARDQAAGESQWDRRAYMSLGAGNRKRDQNGD